MTSTLVNIHISVLSKRKHSDKKKTWKISGHMYHVTLRANTTETRYGKESKRANNNHISDRKPMLRSNLLPIAFITSHGHRPGIRGGGKRHPWISLTRRLLQHPCPRHPVGQRQHHRQPRHRQRSHRGLRGHEKHQPWESGWSSPTQADTRDGKSPHDRRLVIRILGW